MVSGAAAVAGAVAAALKADRLLLLTDVAGVKDATGEVVTELTASYIRKLTADGIIAGGMIPKPKLRWRHLRAGSARRSSSTGVPPMRVCWNCSLHTAQAQ